eukprot:evm.model.NODE_24382_length_11230_cov_24.665895.1
MQTERGREGGDGGDKDEMRMKRRKGGREEGRKEDYSPIQAQMRLEVSGSARMADIGVLLPHSWVKVDAKEEECRPTHGMAETMEARKMARRQKCIHGIEDLTGETKMASDVKQEFRLQEM